MSTGVAAAAGLYRSHAGARPQPARQRLRAAPAPVPTQRRQLQLSGAAHAQLPAQSVLSGGACVRAAADVTTVRQWLLTSLCVLIVADADVVAESVALVAEAGKFVINAEGDLSQADIEITADDNTTITCEEKVRSKYSLEYLKKMIQGSKLSDAVQIKFGNDYPLRLEYLVQNKIDVAVPSQEIFERDAVWY